MEYQINYQMNENIKGMPFSCWKYNQEKGYKYPLHCHAYYEISLVRKGKRDEYYNHQYYNADEGKLFFFSPLSVHGFNNNSEVSDMILQFSPEFININIPNLNKNDIITVVSEKEPFLNYREDKDIEELIDEICALCYSVSDANEESFEKVMNRNINTSMLLLKLLKLLINKGFLTIKHSQNNYLGFPQMETVINTILSDPCNIPTLQEAADLVNLSYYHFSRMFKKTLGINYQEYCNMLRICHAEGLLRETDKSISEIAYEIGYESNTSFIKSFKKFHNITPSKYRDKKHV
ncbi:MAG: AraC family transcriptional regulator [Lachnospiraceae bacterium]|nr:AraC family transcriptional regulator [Lachnospiraceae bacterium]